MAKKDDIDFAALIPGDGGADSVSETYKQKGFRLNKSADLAIDKNVSERKQAGESDVSFTSVMVEAINLYFEKHGIEAEATVNHRWPR